ncbi:MAG TPA: hypothetical protein VFD91_05525 [Mariniphaga sp.]|nr:hypothetical protein [Mariniphaga sp.]
MPGKFRISESQQNYQTLIKEMEDAQLKEVLRRRKLYQKDAARIAVEEALRRELIYSEEDLYAPEYNYEPSRMGLFPTIESPKNRNKIRKSIARSLILAGILPAIWGVVRLKSGFETESLMILIFGIVWMGTSAILFMKYNKFAVGILFGLLTGSAAYVVYYLSRVQQVVFMDLLISVVMYLLILYGLMFVLKIHKKSE